MKAEIAAIKTQHHRAIIKRRLAKAWSSCNRSFFSPTAVTSSHVKTSNHQEDPTMAMTGIFAIDKAVYLQDIDIWKEEAQLYVSKVLMYKGESYFKLQEFTQACEHMYKM